MERQQYDVAIVGGGIIGLSTAMHLTQQFPRLRVAVLEKERDLATHQTGHNSGVIHSGIYYRPGSHKANFCVAGVQKLIRFCEENEIDFERCGKVIVATDESELGRLENLFERGVANGVEGLEMIGPERLHEIEPHAAGIRALWSPGTGIADYPKVAQTYATKFATAGGDIFTEAPVQSITKDGESLAVETAKGTLQTNHMINCAGLYADRVAGMIEDRVEVKIVPFRGEYYTLRPESHHLVSGLIYPVPDPRFPFLGVHYTRSIHGYVEAGPNAVLAFSREGYRKSDIDLGESLETLTYPGFWKMTSRHWRTGLSEMRRRSAPTARAFSCETCNACCRRSARGFPHLAPGGSGVRAQAVASNGVLARCWTTSASFAEGRRSADGSQCSTLLRPERPLPGAGEEGLGEHPVDRSDAGCRG